MLLLCWTSQCAAGGDQSVPLHFRNSSMTKCTKTSHAHTHLRVLQVVSMNRCPFDVMPRDARKPPVRRLLRELLFGNRRGWRVAQEEQHCKLCMRWRNHICHQLNMDAEILNASSDDTSASAAAATTTEATAHVEAPALRATPDSGGQTLEALPVCRLCAPQLIDRRVWLAVAMCPCWRLPACRASNAAACSLASSRKSVASVLCGSALPAGVLGGVEV